MGIFINLFELVKTIALVLVLSFLIRTFLLQTFVVQGKSMEPNFYNRDYLLVDKLSYRVTQPKRGQIVVFRDPENRKIDFVKRIIGLPGERIRITNSTVFVNDKSLQEPYLEGHATQADTPDFNITLSDHQFFVMGDNRENSLDSRRIGPIEGSDILGRVFLRAFPLDRLTLINSVTT